MILSKEPHYSKISLAIDIDAPHLHSEKQGSYVVLLILSSGVTARFVF